MMNKKGVLEIGTIFVILNIFLAIGAVTAIELVMQQYDLQQKLIIAEQAEKIKCTSIIREAMNQEYSREYDELDSIAMVRALDFYGEPDPTDYKSKAMDETSDTSISICSGTRQEISTCVMNAGPKQVVCSTEVYHPTLGESNVIVMIG